MNNFTPSLIFSRRISAKYLQKKPENFQAIFSAFSWFLRNGGGRGRGKSGQRHVIQKGGGLRYGCVTRGGWGKKLEKVRYVLLERPLIGIIEKIYLDLFCEESSVILKDVFHS